MHAGEVLVDDLQEALLQLHHAEESANSQPIRVHGATVIQKKSRVSRLMCERKGRISLFDKAHERGSGDH